MLRTVCFENFVKFKDHQFLDFHNDGPSILIGENGSGKSSVLEGIRRCLKAELSTSVSSTPAPSQLSYFICNFEKSGTQKENVICGIVDIPDESRYENTDSEEEDGTEEQDLVQDLATFFSDKEIAEECLDTTQDDSVGNVSECPTDAAHENANITADGTSHENTYDCQPYGAVEKSETIAKSYYKFAMKYSDPTPEKAQPLHVNLLRVAWTQNDENEVTVNVRNLNNIYDVEGKKFQLMQQKFIHAITSKRRPDTKSTSEKDVKKFLTIVFDKENICKIKERHVEERNECREVLETLSNETVFTFPLRSIGPLQWSESERIHPAKREENYTEAANRCEIIKCYLEDVYNAGQQKFDKKKEKEIFRTITQMQNYKFKLKDHKISLPKGKYALLKTPEGVLEAKALSILMSGKHYKTIILEEPERGMHPQFIERMVEVIKQHSNDKRVILTTHNTTFITPWSLPDCFVFRRKNEDCRIISGREIVGAPTHDNIHMKKLRLSTSDHVSDILFAKKVIFFEGDSEMLFLTELKNQILQGKLKDIEMFHGNEEGYNRLMKNVTGLSLVKMNGKGNTKFCHTISGTLHLEHLILVDRDAVVNKVRNAYDRNAHEKSDTATEEKTDEDTDSLCDKKSEENRDIDLAETSGGDAEEKGTVDVDEISGKDENAKSDENTIEENIEENIDEEETGEIQIDRDEWIEIRKRMLKENGIFFWIDGDIEDMLIKLSEQNGTLRKQLAEENVTLNPETYGKKKQKDEKLFLRENVTLDNVRKCVNLIAENCRANDDLYQFVKYLEDGEFFNK